MVLSQADTAHVRGRSMCVSHRIRQYGDSLTMEADIMRRAINASGSQLGTVLNLARAVAAAPHPSMYDQIAVFVIAGVADT